MNTTTVMLIPLTATSLSDEQIKIGARGFINAINSSISNAQYAKIEGNNAQHEQMSEQEKNSIDIGKSAAVLLPRPSTKHIENLLWQSKMNDLLEEVVALRGSMANVNAGDNINSANSAHTRDTGDFDNNEHFNSAAHRKIFFYPGLPTNALYPYAAELNYKLAVALDAFVVFVVADDCRSNNYGATQDDLVRKNKVVAQPYLTHLRERVLGYVVTHDAAHSANVDTAVNTAIDMKQKATNNSADNNSSNNVNNKLNKHKQLFAAFDADLHLPPLGSLEQQTIKQKQQLFGQRDVVTPALFCYRLKEAARAAQKRIVLPEGSEPRTLQAANICAERGLARCVLLGEKKEITAATRQLGITLHRDIAIVEPQIAAEKYVATLFEVRRHKNISMDEARNMLRSNVVVGTMMLQFDEVDGLVSGAIHTTADTVRPAFQIIKTTKEAKIISSIFFMCLPDGVLVYGDCAVNVNPTASELADIAIQSANSAQRFGITPRVALLSYSTGASGFGEEVDKVRDATEIAKRLRPDLLIDGPLQYDAAINPTVAQLKAPHSPVAGKANVFIFPDLNSGNIGYKTVQRSTNVVCIGPMLQGMRKPINDLSRGCSVEDIVLTIALTAVQAH